MIRSAVLLLMLFSGLLLPSMTNARVKATAHFMPGDTLFWSAERMLEPADFQGESALGGNIVRDTIGLSTVGFLYRFELVGQTLKVNSFAYFIRNQSWIKDSSANTLKHEQGHFDIEQIYAKQLEAFANKNQDMPVDSLMEFVEREYRKLYRECARAHLEYDMYATRPSTYERKLKWIDEQLRSMNLK